MMNATPSRGQFNKPITSVAVVVRHLNHGHTCELHFESFIKLALGNSTQMYTCQSYNCFWGK